MLPKTEKNQGTDRLRIPKPSAPNNGTPDRVLLAMVNKFMWRVMMWYVISLHETPPKFFTWWLNYYSVHGVVPPSDSQEYFDMLSSYVIRWMQKHLTRQQWECMPSSNIHMDIIHMLWAYLKPRCEMAFTLNVDVINSFVPLLQHPLPAAEPKLPVRGPIHLVKNMVERSSYTNWLHGESGKHTAEQGLRDLCRFLERNGEHDRAFEFFEIMRLNDLEKQFKPFFKPSATEEKQEIIPLCKCKTPREHLSQYRKHPWIVDLFDTVNFKLILDAHTTMASRMEEHLREQTPEIKFADTKPDWTKTEEHISQDPRIMVMDLKSANLRAFYAMLRQCGLTIPGIQTTDIVDAWCEIVELFIPEFGPLKESKHFRQLVLNAIAISLKCLPKLENMILHILLAITKTLGADVIEAVAISSLDSLFVRFIGDNTHASVASVFVPEFGCTVGDLVRFDVPSQQIKVNAPRQQKLARDTQFRRQQEQKQQGQKLVTARETKYGKEVHAVFRNTPRALQSALSTSEMSIDEFNSLRKQLIPKVQLLPKSVQVLWRDITTIEGALMFIHAHQIV